MSSPEVQVRQAVFGDAEAIATIIVRLFLETESVRLDFGTQLEVVKGILMDPSTGVFLLAIRNGEIAGQTLVRKQWLPWKNSHCWQISAVYVAEGHRQRGCYRALHAYVRQLAKQEGATALRLGVSSSNERAKKTYKALDMHQTGRVYHLGMLFGEDPTQSAEEAP